ncbi:GtrA family protein [Mesorhizobium hawassense]|uniref:GtrA family protein n=1 Tax=Mesorhizobium hawassense TaxID=1209954 RepID=A0A330HGB3_9HYPH|nr:GtrA family protein [Mesorhizobium hawassense]RAZ85604.1 GtrA family protein [Mesorhizobium hawassense]
MKRRSLALRYSAFAAVAAVINVAVQYAVLLLWDTGGILVLAVGAGTLAGLLVKYLLDKLWIFYDEGIDFKTDGWKFLIYTAVGGFTTIIFWGAEAAAWAIWRTELMRNLGAVIGLTAGYMVKYQLDKRFVFAHRQLRTAR